MAEIKLHRKLIYKGDAHRAILEADPKLAYCIERIKAVDAVEVVHGRWHEVDGETEWECHYRCSKCFTQSYELTNYCPNCGAKMDGDRNG